MIERFLKKKFDPISSTAQLSQFLSGALPIVGGDAVRRRMLDVLLNIGVPFNRWLGLRIKKFTPQTVSIESPPSVLRRNHVGTAHACAQALIGEYAAGLVVAQNFTIDDYRIIIGKLEIEYHKAGRGHLLGMAHAPNEWPKLIDGEGWVEMKTEITDEKANLISVCQTKWQVKSWQRIEADRIIRKTSKDAG
jgi:acyl-coenzyme A thioesterase PaaI-like protein